MSNWPVLWYDNLDSTSEEAKRRARSGDFGPFWICARSQSQGRGRLGRDWVSPPGNLFATALFTEPGGLEVATRIAFAAGLAVIDTCRQLVPGADFRLKWPNDVRVNRAKLAGILIESGHYNGALWVAAGIGVNVQTAPDGTGQDTQSLAGLGAGPHISPDIVIEALVPAFSRRVEQARTDFPQQLHDWQMFAEGLGATLSAGPKDKPVQGVFEGLNEQGGLVLRLPNGETRTINAGDVEILRHSG